jgi:hypothetical protein
MRNHANQAQTRDDAAMITLKSSHRAAVSAIVAQVVLCQASQS